MPSKNAKATTTSVSVTVAPKGAQSQNQNQVPAPQPNQNGQKKAKQAKQQQGSRAMDFLKVSSCVTKYALSLDAPWLVDDVCVPASPAFPSRKVRVWAKGSFSTGTSGCGFISLIPTALGLNNGNPIKVTDATYAGTTIVETGTGVAAVNTNAPFATSALGANLRYRLVSAGIRVRYMGTELNRGGLIHLLEHPGHLTLANFAASGMAAYETAVISSVQRGWHSVTYHPISDAEVDYATTVGSIPYIGVIASSPNVTTPLIFEYQVFGNFEYQGLTVQPDVTASESDSAGFEMARTAAMLMHRKQGDRPDPDSSGYLRWLNDAWLATLAGSLTYVGAQGAPLGVQFAQSVINDFAGRARGRQMGLPV